MDAPANLRDELNALNARKRPLARGVDIDTFANQARRLHRQARRVGDPALLHDAEALMNVADHYMWRRLQGHGW